MGDTTSTTVLRRRIRQWLGAFVIALVLSGLTAFPLVHELRLADGLGLPVFGGWLHHVRVALDEADTRYPFLLYGTDWLAFAHLVIATAFIGPYRDPVRNVWIVQWAMIACAGIVPLALVCGPIRGIPFGWTCIDMAFGVVGIVPLLVVRRLIGRLAAVGGEPEPGAAPPAAGAG